MCTVPWSLRTTLLLLLGLLLPLPLMFLSLLGRFLLRPPGARRFRSFDRVGRPQLRSHSCASSNVGSTHPSCVPTQQCLPLSFASGVHPSKLDGAINLSGVFPFNARLLSSVFLLLHVHASLYSRCTGVCICTRALRQTPHGHMRKGVLGSVCVCMYSVCLVQGGRGRTRASSRCSGERWTTWT